MNNTQTTTHKAEAEAVAGVFFIMHKENEELKEIIKKNISKMSRHIEKMDKLSKKELNYLYEEAKKPNYKGTRDKLINLYDKYLKCLIVLEKSYDKLKTIEEAGQASIMFDSNLKNSIKSQFERIFQKYIKYTLNKKFEG